MIYSPSFIAYSARLALQFGSSIVPSSRHKARSTTMVGTSTLIQRYTLERQCIIGTACKQASSIDVVLA